MNLETWRKANKLQRDIEVYKTALECFEEPTYNTKGEYVGHSRDPKLAIEHIDEEWEGRTVTVLPDLLSKDFIEVMKTHMKSRIEELEKEFNAL